MVLKKKLTRDRKPRAEPGGIKIPDGRLDGLSGRLAKNRTEDMSGNIELAVQKRLWCMEDLPDGLLMMIAKFAGPVFFKRAGAWLILNEQRKDFCDADQLHYSTQIAWCNAQCRYDSPLAWARVLGVESIPSNILACPITLEACKCWFVKQATRMCEQGLCLHNIKLIYKRDWTAPSSWNEWVAMRREHNGVSPDSQSDFIREAAERQAEWFLAVLLYKKGLLGPAVQDLDPGFESNLSRIKGWGDELRFADWWLRYQEDNAKYHTIAMADASARAELAHMSEVLASGGESLYLLLKWTLNPKCKQNTTRLVQHVKERLKPGESSTQSGTQSGT